MTNGKPKLPPRQSLNEEAGEQTDTQAIRRPIGQMKNLDADYYVAKYPECKFIWENDIGGAVQRWIDYGAEPVEVENRSGRTFEGITDKSESKWVRAVGGDDGMGNHFWVYLLKCSPELYDDVKLKPVRDRQAAIQKALFGGRDQSGGKGGELGTYAPNLPTGDRGMSVSHETES